MDAVFAVILEAVAGGSGFEEDGFGRFADGDDGDGLKGQIQRLTECIFAEIEDETASEAFLAGFEENALGCEAKVDIGHFVFGDSGADDDERSGLGAWFWEMLLGECAAEGDNRPNFAGRFPCDKPES